MPLKTSAYSTAPVHRSPADYTPDMQNAPQWAKNMQERLSAAKYNPYTTYGGSAAYNRFQDDYDKVQSWKAKSTTDQWANDYLIKRR